jgi:alpha-beta hydrolase superfamily lysophospholipase
VSWWEQLLAIVGPLAGVAVGALMTRGESRRAFKQGVAIDEVQRRREVAAAYQEAFCAFKPATARAVSDAERWLATRQHPPAPARSDFQSDGRTFEPCRRRSSAGVGLRAVSSAGKG